MDCDGRIYPKGNGLGGVDSSGGPGEPVEDSAAVYPDRWTHDRRVACGLAGRSVHWLAGYWQVFKDASGEPLRMIGVNLDITERKRVEEAVAEARRQVQSIIDNTPALVYAFDLEERFFDGKYRLGTAAQFHSRADDRKEASRVHAREDADWHEENDRRVIEAGRRWSSRSTASSKGARLHGLRRSSHYATRREGYTRWLESLLILPSANGPRKRFLKGRARFKLLSDTAWQLLATDSRRRPSMSFAGTS